MHRTRLRRPRPQRAARRAARQPRCLLVPLRARPPVLLELRQPRLEPPCRPAHGRNRWLRGTAPVYLWGRLATGTTVAAGVGHARTASGTGAVAFGKRRYASRPCDRRRLRRRPPAGGARMAVAPAAGHPRTRRVKQQSTTAASLFFGTSLSLAAVAAPAGDRSPTTNGRAAADGTRAGRARRAARAGGGVCAARPPGRMHLPWQHHRCHGRERPPGRRRPSSSHRFSPVRVAAVVCRRGHHCSSRPANDHQRPCRARRAPPWPPMLPRAPYCRLTTPAAAAMPSRPRQAGLPPMQTYRMGNGTHCSHPKVPNPGCLDKVQKYLRDPNCQRRSRRPLGLAPSPTGVGLDPCCNTRAFHCGQAATDARIGSAPPRGGWARGRRFSFAAAVALTPATHCAPFHSPCAVLCFTSLHDVDGAGTLTLCGPPPLPLVLPPLPTIVSWPCGVVIPPCRRPSPTHDPSCLRP